MSTDAISPLRQRMIEEALLEILDPQRFRHVVYW
jgi:hypothetical protein